MYPVAPLSRQNPLMPTFESSGLRPPLRPSQSVRFQGVVNAVMDLYEGLKRVDTSLPEFETNSVAVVQENERYLETILSLLDRARHSIKMDCFYIGGKTGEQILARLQKKSREGVQIYYRGDKIKGFEDSQTEVRPAKRRLQRFTRYLSRFFYTEHYRRDPFQVIGVNHNKLIIIDNNTVFLSSKNPCEADIKNRDASLVMRGPVVGELTRHFNRGWKQRTGQDLDERPAALMTLPEAIEERFETQLCRPVITSHYKRNALRAMLRLINNSEQSIQLHGFCLTNRHILNALLDAAKKGKKVEVLLDSGIAYPFRMPNVVAFKELLDASKKYPNLSVKSYYHQDLKEMEKPDKKVVHQYKNHSKLLISDGKQAIVGSTNFSNADVVHQENISIELKDGSAVQEMADQFQQDWNRNSVEVPKITFTEKCVAKLTKWIYEF